MFKTLFTIIPQYYMQNYNIGPGKKLEGQIETKF